MYIVPTPDNVPSHVAFASDFKDAKNKRRPGLNSILIPRERDEKLAEYHSTLARMVGGTHILALGHSIDDITSIHEIAGSSIPHYQKAMDDFRYMEDGCNTVFGDCNNFLHVIWNSYAEPQFHDHDFDRLVCTYEASTLFTSNNDVVKTPFGIEVRDNAQIFQAQEQSII